jgi:hypothetical protein
MTEAWAQSYTNSFIQLINALPIGIGAIMVAYAMGLDPAKNRFWVLVAGIHLIAGGIKLGIGDV